MSELKLTVRDFLDRLVGNFVEKYEPIVILKDMDGKLIMKWNHKLGLNSENYHSALEMLVYSFTFEESYGKKILTINCL